MRKFNWSVGDDAARKDAFILFWVCREMSRKGVIAMLTLRFGKEFNRSAVAHILTRRKEQAQNLFALRIYDEETCEYRPSYVDAFIGNLLGKIPSAARLNILTVQEGKILDGEDYAKKLRGNAKHSFSEN